MNLGSPDSPSVKDVKKYLNEFLMDERVIDKPLLLRTLLVKGIIVPFRAANSAEAYHSIWTKEGSPLVHITKLVQHALQEKIDIPVEVAMRYGNPDMKTAFNNMLSLYPDVKEVVLLPMYPHYAMSSYETAVVQAVNVHQKNNYPFSITTIKPFYDHPLYIEALAASIKPHLKAGHHLLFSYHSIPEGHITKRDVTGSHCMQNEGCCDISSPAHEYCYRHQCIKTMQLVTEKLGMNKNDYSVAFQSKLGREEWLKPSTTSCMAAYPAKGIKDLIVVCPSFVSDCLETLEEIQIRERANFMKAGGTSYHYIPCMNTHPLWIDAIISWAIQIEDNKSALVFKPHAAYV